MTSPKRSSRQPSNYTAKKSHASGPLWWFHYGQSLRGWLVFMLVSMVLNWFWAPEMPLGLHILVSAVIYVGIWYSEACIVRHRLRRDR